MRRRLASAKLIIVDLIIVMVLPYLALLIRFDGGVDTRYYAIMTDYLPIMVAVRLASFYFFGLYHRLWRYASINELLAIVGAVTLSSFLIILYVVLIGPTLPRSIHVLSWFLHISFVGSSRMFIRVVHNLRHQAKGQFTNVLIVGAGDAGAMIAREITQRYYDTKRLIGFVDDAPEKRDHMLMGAKILGERKDVGSIVKQHGVSEIIIAMPSVTGDAIREIIQECKTTGCEVKIVPGMYELIDGKVTVQQLRKVELTDLLRRDPVKLNLEEITEYIADKSVLITGAGGSIGSELCRQIAKLSPKNLVLLGKGENSIYEIERELLDKYPTLNLKPIIADIRDKKRMRSVFSLYKPQVVFHAAAHKHVPLMEVQPEEAVRNNVFGTQIVAEAADRCGTEVFVMISTDKAVNPTSVMGATKRVAELIIQNMSRVSSTKFLAVRFGNVLGSRGSVVPMFKKQIAKGGPVTITHPDMQRYFMTIPEASQLVLQAGALAKGGEVFVLDMGEPVKIVDMAHDLIKLSGLVPGKDIKIGFTGLRPGEKLFEELLTAEEGTTSSRHEKIFVANIKMLEEGILQRGLLNLRDAENKAKIIEILGELVPAYKITREKYCNILTKDIKGKKEEMTCENEYGLNNTLSIGSRS